MGLPNCSKAVLAPEKLRDYLLSPAHPIGRYKALFFRTLGYDQTSWQQLETDLRLWHRYRPSLWNRQNTVRNMRLLGR